MRITGYASYGKGRPAPDEDAMTMMIAVGRKLGQGPGQLGLASTAQGVQAGLVVEALGLPANTFCLTCTTSDRGATEALRALGSGLVLAADGGYAAGIRLGADPGVAPGVAEVLAMQSATAAYPGLDLAIPDYIELAYVELVRQAAAGLTADYLALNPPEPRLAQRVGLGGQIVLAPPGSGAAGPLLALIAALEQASPGQRILLVSYGKGSAADAILVQKEVG